MAGNCGKGVDGNVKLPTTLPCSMTLASPRVAAGSPAYGTPVRLRSLY
jgi:hypothetical protein